LKLTSFHPKTTKSDCAFVKAHNLRLLFVGCLVVVGCSLEMDIRFILCLFLTVAMSRTPEKKHCQSRGDISIFQYCPPCWEQENCSKSFFKRLNILGHGMYHRLYPEKSESWEAIEAGGDFWNNEKWLARNEENYNEAGTCTM
jgi:hypothetical protein